MKKDFEKKYKTTRDTQNLEYSLTNGTFIRRKTSV
jgi:hypothetical protein